MIPITQLSLAFLVLTVVSSQVSLAPVLPGEDGTTAVDDGHNTSQTTAFAGIDLDQFSSQPDLQKQVSILKTAGNELERVRAFLALTRSFPPNPLTDQQATDLYTAGLRDSNVVIQTRAAHRIGGGSYVNNLPSKTVQQNVMEPLIAVLKDRTSERGHVSYRMDRCVRVSADSVMLRKTIIHTLGETGDERAVGPVLKCLADRELTRVVIQALGKLSQTGRLKEILRRDAFAPVSTFLEADSPQLLVDATQTLRNMDRERSFRMINDRLQKGDRKQRRKSAIAMGIFDSEAADQALLKALTDQDPGVRSSAVWALNQPYGRKDERFVDVILPLLQDQDPGVRSGAAHSLSGVEDDRVVENVLPLLKDPHPDVRAGAVHTIGRCRDRSVFERIVGLLDDGNRNVRYTTLRALAALGDPRAVEPIKRLIERHPDLRSSATGVLKQLEAAE